MSDADETTDSSEEEETYSLIRTVLGSTQRTDRWHLTDEVSILTALGRSRFDLRGAVPTDSPVVEISVTCVLGGVSMWVPHGTLVVLDGTSFLASASSHVSPGDCDRLPRIEVNATTVLGRVKVRSLDDEPMTLVTTDPADTAPADTAPPAVAEPVTPDAVVAEPVTADAIDDTTTPLVPEPAVAESATADAIASEPVAAVDGEDAGDDAVAAAS